MSFDELCAVMNNRVQRVSVLVSSSDPRDHEEVVVDLVDLGDILDQVHDHPTYKEIVGSSTAEQLASHPVSKVLLFWWQAVFYVGVRARAGTAAPMADMVRRVLEAR